MQQSAAAAAWSSPQPLLPLPPSSAAFALPLTATLPVLPHLSVRYFVHVEVAQIHQICEIIIFTQLLLWMAVRRYRIHTGVLCGRQPFTVFYPYIQALLHA